MLLNRRPASPSLSSMSRRSSSSASHSLPFANVTNTPASRAPAAAIPASQDESKLSGTVGIPKGSGAGNASRRRSHGLENLQMQLQGLMSEGNQIQARYLG